MKRGAGECLRRFENDFAPHPCNEFRQQSGGYSSVLPEAHTHAGNRKYLISTFRFLQLSAQLPSLSISQLKKNATLYQVLRTIADRNEISSFTSWANVWDLSHESSDHQLLNIEIPYTKSYPYCPRDNTARFAMTSLQGSGDQGIELCLDSHHHFTNEQQEIALNKVASTAVLKMMVLPSRHQFQKHFLDNALISKSSRYTSMIDEAKDPEDVILLIDTMIELGAKPYYASKNRETACSNYSRFADSLTEAQISSNFEKRQNALLKIKKKLCEK